MAQTYTFQDYAGAEIEALLHLMENLGPATDEDAGLMSAADKAKLDGVAAGAQANVIEGIKLNDTTLVPVAKIISILIDNAPASGSANPISSGAIYTELAKYYTKTQVDTLIAAIKQFTYEVVAELPTASAETMYCIYFVPSSNPKTRNIKDEYITVRTGSEGAYTYSWEQIGTTAVDISGKADKDPNAVEGNIAKFDSNGNPVDGGIPANNVAQKDGYYEKMGVGIAKYIEGETPVTGSFMERTTGGDAEVANGIAQIQEVKGKSQVWNQIFKGYTNDVDGITKTWDADSRIYTISGTYTGTSDFVNLYTFVNLYATGGHKYFIFGYKTDKVPLIYLYGAFPGSSISDDAAIITATSSGAISSYIRVLVNPGESVNFDIRPQMFDLTLLGIDSLTTVAEVEAWLAENIGLKAYYPYNAGTVLNNKMVGMESIGRNLLNATTGKARIIGAYSDVYGNYYGITGTHGALTFTSDLGETSTITPDSDGKFLLETPGWLDVATPGEDCAVFLWWDGTKTDYVEHKVSKAYVDVTKIWGKKNGTGSLVQVFPNGMAGVNDVKDILRNEGGVTVARRRMGVVDLGTLTWTKNTSLVTNTTVFVSSVITTRKSSVNLLTSKYVNVGLRGELANRIGIATYNAVNNTSVIIRDDSLNNKTDAEVASVLSGVPLYYELATEEVYTDLVYQGSDHFADGTPVTLPVSVEVDNWGIERVIPQNDTDVVTAIPEISCKYSIDIVETAKTQEDEIENLDDKKADKNGVYDGMSVGSAKTLVGDTSAPAEYVFRKVPDEAATGNAFLMSVKGKSLVWNQMVQNGNFADGTQNWMADGATISVTDGVITWTATDNLQSRNLRQINVPFTNGHKYLLRFSIKGSQNNRAGGALGTVGGGGGFTSYISYGTDWTKIAVFLNPATTNDFSLYIRPNTDTIEDFVAYIKNIDVVDLTLMFGSGNEPSTVEEFEALYPLPYYAYNAGGIISNKTEQIESVGFNQWDEEWELGQYSVVNGTKINDGTGFRCKQLIPILPNTSYYFHCGARTTQNIGFVFYDSAGAYISGDATNQMLFTTPSNAHFMTFFTGTWYPTTYQNDICINLSNPAKNGTYEPYDKRILDLNLPTLTGKVNGEGESVVICADGLKSAGDVYDEGIVENGYLTKIVKRIGAIDMGTLTWELVGNNLIVNKSLTGVKPASSTLVIGNLLTNKYIASYWNDTSTNKIVAINSASWLRVQDSEHTSAPTEQDNWLSGVMLNYELAEPVTYVLDTPVLVRYHVEAGGTERRLPEDTASVVNAPFRGDAKYSVDAVGFINKAPQNYQTKESDDSLLAAINAAISGTITKTWDASQNKYVYTFTPES